MSNKAVLLTHFSPADPTAGIKVSELEVPRPGEGQVLVRLRLRPINPSDVMCLEGWYKGFKPKQMPAVPGYEGMGVVAENGPGCTRFAVGQRVVGAPFECPIGNGTWQQYTLVREAALLAVPDSVSDEAAAQFFVNPLSAYALLEESKVPEGEYLLQSAAGSTLGRLLIQMAKARGTKTINIVRRRDLVEELKQLGADEVVVSSEEDVVQRVKEISGGRGAYAGVDCVGGEVSGLVAAAVRDGGTVRVYGRLQPGPAQFDAADLFFRGVIIQGFWLYLLRVNEWSEEQWQRALSTVMGWLADGTITPYSGRRFPLERAAEAVRESEKPGREGKVLLEG